MATSILRYGLADQGHRGGVGSVVRSKYDLGLPGTRNQKHIDPGVGSCRLTLRDLTTPTRPRTDYGTHHQRYTSPVGTSVPLVVVIL